jgi:HK97 family phage major capsid protein/HK97 family phage prohead protease
LIRDNIVRAIFPGPELREETEGLGTLTGRFAVFDVWTRIDSALEGTFMERIAPGAFAESFRNTTPKVLFQHGQDPQIGDKPLGVPARLEEGSEGAEYDVPLLDTTYNRDLKPGLAAGAYGASFRFAVQDESIIKTPAKSDYNPDALPERTITKARVFEFGPVTFPAYQGATASMRSMTDQFVKRQIPPPPTPDPEPPEPPTPEPPKEPTPVEYLTRDEKAARLVELKDIITRQASAFPGEMPADVKVAWDKDNAEHDQLVRDIAAWDKRMDRVAELGEDKTRTVPGSAPAVIRTQSPEDIHDIAKIRSETRTREEYDTKIRENALRSIDQARVPKSANLGELKDLVENRDEGEEGEGEVARRILLTGSPLYRRAFNKYLLGLKDLWSPEEARAAALAVTGTTTTGGYAVPYIFDPTLLHIGVYTAQNPFRAACRTVTITNGNNWRTVTVGAVTSAYVTEAAAATEQGPTFGQPTYTVQRGHAFATVSIETLQDRPDIGSELSSVFAESKATYEENQFAVGVGTTVFPLGMFTDTAYTNKDTATNDVTAIADILALEGDLPLRHRANGAFFMNRSTLRQLMALDTTYRYFSGQGLQYAGQVGPVRQESGNTGMSLLGYPVWEVPSAVSTLTTDGAIIVVFCDPQSYVIVDRIGMNVEVIQNMLNGATPSFPTGQRGIYCYWRNTAKPINADAGRSLSVQ